MVLQQIDHHAVLEDDALRLRRRELNRLEPHLPRVGLSDRRWLHRRRQRDALAEGGENQKNCQAGGSDHPTVHGDSGLDRVEAWLAVAADFPAEAGLINVATVRLDLIKYCAATR